MGTVYLIHLARPVAEGRPAQHYLGYAANLAARIERHRANSGAAMLRAANLRGIPWEVVATWSAGRGGEVQFKRRRNHKKLCPICRGTSR